MKDETGDDMPKPNRLTTDATMTAFPRTLCGANKQQECIHDHRLPDGSGTVMMVPLSTSRTTGKSE